MLVFNKDEKYVVLMQRLAKLRFLFLLSSDPYSSKLLNQINRTIRKIEKLGGDPNAIIFNDQVQW